MYYISALENYNWRAIHIQKVANVLHMIYTWFNTKKTGKGAVFENMCPCGLPCFTGICTNL